MVSVNTEAQVTDLTVDDRACLTVGKAEELAAGLPDVGMSR